MSRSIWRRMAGALAVTLVALSVAACGGDDDNEIFTQSRFCDLSRQLDGAIATAGLATLPGKVEGPPEAFGKVFEQMGQTVDELQSAAPSDVSSEVATVVEALKKGQDGDPAAVQASSFTEAQAKIAAYQEASCNPGGGSGDG